MIVLVSLGVLPIIPIVQAEATLPRFGHAQIVLPAETIGKPLCLAQREDHPTGSLPAEPPKWLAGCRARDEGDHPAPAHPEGLMRVILRLEDPLRREPCRHDRDIE